MGIKCGGIWLTPFADGKGADEPPEPMDVYQELARTKERLAYWIARTEQEMNKSLMEKIGDSWFNWLRKHCD